MEKSLNIVYKLEYNTLKLVLWGWSPFHKKQLKGNAYVTVSKDRNIAAKQRYYWFTNAYSKPEAAQLLERKPNF